MLVAREQEVDCAHAPHPAGIHEHAKTVPRAQTAGPPTARLIVLPGSASAEVSIVRLTAAARTTAPMSGARALRALHSPNGVGRALGFAGRMWVSMTPGGSRYASAGW